MLRNIRIIAGREYRATVFTRAFLLGTILAPFMIGAMMFVFGSAGAHTEGLVAAGTISQTERSLETDRMIASGAAAGLLLVTLLISSASMLNSTLEEKSNRVMEMLLAATGPLEILAGKIVGNALTGLTVAAVWGIAAIVSLTQLGVSPAIEYTPGLFAKLFFFFITGYLMYGTIYSAIGSMCMTLQEAQSFLIPMALLIMAPLISLQTILEDPNGNLAFGLTMFPLSAPIVMMLRLGLTPPPPVWQIACSMAMMLTGVLVAVYASSKVFRIAILIYGRPPRVRQLIRWIVRR